MKIGIIGAGAIGKTYGELLKRAGHEVMLSSRNPENIEAGNYQIGTVTEAAAFGEVVIIAVNYPTVDNAIAQMKNHLDGKLVIDTTNPLYSDENGNLKQLIEEDEVAGVIMQQKIPKARVAKAFTTLWTGYVEQYSNVLEPSLIMTYAVDEERDEQVVTELIKDSGLIPFKVGTVAQSRPLDPGSPLWNVKLTPEQAREKLRVFRTTKA